MEIVDKRRCRERRSKILNFRIPPSVEVQLVHHLDPDSRIRSPDQAARKVLIEALAEHEQRVRLGSFAVDKMNPFEIFTGDAQAILSKLPSRICRTCVTSPPYFRQRDYGHSDQIGQERTPDRYISRLAEVFEEVHRLLRDDGTLWVVIDDTYWKKQLVGIPWRLAFELQRRGWFWRAEIVWSKASTPEAAKDRPTRAHEAILLFSKKPNYFYGYDALLEPHDNPWTIDCIKKAQENGQTARPRSDPFFTKQERREKGSTGLRGQNTGRS